jgi:hypothetical protein
MRILGIENYYATSEGVTVNLVYEADNKGAGP